MSPTVRLIPTHIFIHVTTKSAGKSPQGVDPCLQIHNYHMYLKTDVVSRACADHCEDWTLNVWCFPISSLGDRCHFPAYSLNSTFIPLHKSFPFSPVLFNSFLGLQDLSRYYLLSMLLLVFLSAIVALTLPVTVFLSKPYCHQCHCPFGITVSINSYQSCDIPTLVS